MSPPRLLVHTAPFLRPTLTTPRLMFEVVATLVPVVLAAAWLFGVTALLVLAAAVIGAAGTEWALSPAGRRGASLRDGSAVLTGLLLGCTLPPGVPLWMAGLGGVAAVALGKAAWGGLGHNLFNPALVGRAFLQAAFPVPMTTWIAHGTLADFGSLSAATLALPFMHGSVDGMSAATPLALMKFQHQATSLWELLAGSTAGSLGETSAALLIACGLWLGLRRAFDWRIPVSMLAAVAVLSGVLWALAPGRYPAPWFMLLSGGLLFGAVFMATDPVTSPATPLGAWLFGAGAGVLVVLIRIWGGLPEGVMYSILLMNAATPLLERVVQPRAFGRRRIA